MVTMTAEARRAAAKAEFDVFLADCPSRQVFARLGEKWSGIAVLVLADGPRRFSRLRRDIPGVSQKMLTQTLRTLERDGLVTRRVEATVPVTVEYALTPLGRSLVEPTLAVKRWAEAAMPEILAARAAYDARSEGDVGSG